MCVSCFMKSLHIRDLMGILTTSEVLPVLQLRKCEAGKVQGHAGSKCFRVMSEHLCGWKWAKAYSFFGKLVTTWRFCFCAPTGMNQLEKHLAFQNMYSVCRCTGIYYDLFSIPDFTKLIREALIVFINTVLYTIEVIQKVACIIF